MRKGHRVGVRLIGERGEARDGEGEGGKERRSS